MAFPPMLAHFMKYHLLYLTALYIAGGWGLAWYYDAADRFSLLVYLESGVVMSLRLAVLFAGFAILRIMIVERPRHLTRAILAAFRDRWLTRDRLLQGLPLLAAFLCFISAFSSLKSMIPVVQPYVWDPFFAELDRLIHFGFAPWRLLQPLVGYPFLTFALNVVYNLWLPAMLAVLYWQVFTLERPALRAQYLLSFFLCWIVNGTILAMLFSSAGPCFYGKLLPDLPNPFEPLMAYLHAADGVYPVWALRTQEMLWSTYRDNGLVFGSGISAMPSLHISIAFLQLMLGLRIGRAWAGAFAAFFALILIGAVHLGWHYAADAYLSVFTTFLIWTGTGWALRRLYV